MVRVLSPLLALGLAWPGAALANGRTPATVNVRFQPGDDQLILLPSTFGLLVSTDDGATFRWVCEDTIGYGGTYDPDYAVAASGDIYSTTFEGLRVSHDGGCTFETITGPFDGKWIGEVEVASDGRVWAITSTGGEPNDVYVSEDGQSFISANSVHQSAWWKTIRIAQAEPGAAADRVYLTGFLPGTESTESQALLRRSDSGGEPWVDLDVADFAFGSQPQLFIEGVSPTNPDVVFARVLQANPPLGDSLYRSTDAGENWTKVLDMEDTITAFAIRSDGQTVIAGTVNRCAQDPEGAEKGCVRISPDLGDTWEAPASQPKMACVGERGDGTLLACGSNYEPDLFALGRSTSGESWDAVLRLSEITGPLSCPEGTIQADCAATTWLQTCVRIGVCEAPDAGPGAAADGGEAAADGGGGGGGGGGCGCRASKGAPGAATLLILLAFVRRRRR